MKSLHKTPIKNPIVFKIISFISNIPLWETCCIVSISNMYTKKPMSNLKSLILILNFKYIPKGKYISVLVTTRNNV